MLHAAASLPNAHGETILVVDDDQAVRRITMRSLRSKGYDVLEACDGPGALELSAQYEGPIHLVLSDSMMPGMNGAAVVERLRRGRPALKAVFMSGYGGSDVLLESVAGKRAGFVQKPFAFADLLRTVREQLDG